MDESIDDKPLVLKVLFADMFSPDFKIVQEKIISPGEKGMLFDFQHIKDETLSIIGTSVRVNSLTANENKITAEIYGAGNFKAYIRLRTPFPVKEAFIDGVKCSCSYDELTKTALISFDSVAKPRVVMLHK